jgi:DNA-binding response OmpR family regulator
MGMSCPHIEITRKPERRMIVKESIINHKKLLIVDDEPDILTTLEREILDSCPDTKIDKATNYEDATQFLKSRQYDLIILDIMGVRGFDLLEIAVERKSKVAMFTAHALSPEALKKSYDMGARAYLPKDKLGALVPFLEDVLQNEYKSGWKLLVKKLGNYYDKKFQSTDWKNLSGDAF